MGNIVFDPWVGSKYNQNNRFGIPVLVLGESHYGEEAETRATITTEVVRRLAQDERHSFFTKVSKLLLGLDKNDSLDDVARGEVWEHIAFYNFIQGFVDTDPRVKPSPEMWNVARAPFLKVIEALQPKVVLVLGKELAKHLPETPKEIEVCCIQHPSTGFSYSQWNPLFSQAVQRAKSREGMRG